MPGPDTVEHCFTQLLASIQRRHNFHPEWGASQITNVDDREVQRDFGQFAAITSTITRCGLEVQIPYDATGLTPEEHLQRRRAAAEYVYFAKLLGRPEWKIGRSRDPIMRCRRLQTGNQRLLEPKYQVEGDRELEKLVLRNFKRYRSKDRGGREWFYRLDEAHIRDVIERIRREGRDFLMRPRPRE